MILIILAAGKSNRIYRKIKKHKCLIEIKNKSLIQKIIDDANKKKYISEIRIVVGFKKKDLINNLKHNKVTFINNDQFSKKEMLYSMQIGLKNVKEDAIITYSDIYYSHKIFDKLYKKKSKNILLPILKNWQKVWSQREKDIYQDCETLIYNKKLFLKEIGKKVENYKQIMGQYMGLIFIPKEYHHFLQLEMNKNKNNSMHISTFLNSIINRNINIKCLPISTRWYEFDDIEDLKNF